MKDGTKTFWFGMVAMATATVLAGLKIIDGDAWMWVVGIAIGAKGLQGAVERIPLGAGSRRTEQPL